MNRYVEMRESASDPVDPDFKRRAALWYEVYMVSFLLLKVVFYSGKISEGGITDNVNGAAASASAPAPASSSASASASASASGHAVGQMGRGELPAGKLGKLRDSLALYYHAGCAIHAL
jgi:hypothetical protein